MKLWLQDSSRSFCTNPIFEFCKALGHKKINTKRSWRSSQNPFSYLVLTNIWEVYFVVLETKLGFEGANVSLHRNWMGKFYFGEGGLQNCCRCCYLFLSISSNLTMLEFVDVIKSVSFFLWNFVGIWQMGVQSPNIVIHGGFNFLLGV